MKKSKLEKVLEYVVNGEGNLATELLHEHIVESAREIYADIAEQDEAAEAALDLDEDEDLDEGYHEDDASGDFEDDLDSMSDELETEEYFGEDDGDDDDAMDDLEGEMDMDSDDMDSDMDMDNDDMDTDMESGEEAFVNVEDAIDELKAVFADLMGTDMDDMEDDMEDEVGDEFGDVDLGFDDDEEELGEDAKLTAHSVTMAGDEDGKASPIKQNQAGLSGKGKAVNFAGGADEKGGKGDVAKKMSVTGPQEQNGKMNKTVSKPSNKSEKSKSNLGS